MRVTEIKYEHVVPTEHESETLGATAVVFEFENPDDAFEDLKKIVNKNFSSVPIVQPELPMGIPATEEGKVVEKVESTAPTETKQDDTTTTKVAEEPSKKVTKKKAKKKATKKAKHIVYDRDDDNHKKELGTYLNEVFPKWEESLPKASALSISLDKKVPLYDANGDVTQEFKDAVVEGMK